MNIPRIAVIAAIAGAVLALSACGTTSSPISAAGTTTPATAVVTSAASPTLSISPSGMPMPAAPAGPHNQADITFAQQMTVHHWGAIAMADLAPTRSASSQVKSLAAAIKAAQAPEITEMAGWLATWAPSTDMNGTPNTAASAMGGMTGMGGSSSAMPGMMTGQQMTALTAASGAAFDRMFLQLMITHHQGALMMATTEKAHGSNPAALNLAQDITSSQTAQITQMQSLLKSF